MMSKLVLSPGNDIFLLQPNDSPENIYATFASDIVKVESVDIESIANRFIDDVPLLMKALDEVEKLHPFMGGK